MTIETNPHITNAVAKMMIYNTLISGAIAFAVFVGFVVIAIFSIISDIGPDKLIPQPLIHWGGVIIGFYFGSAITQTSGLISAIRGDTTPQKP